jgi:hypothetical protein
MVKQQKIKRETKKEPTIICEKTIPQTVIDPKYANAPVRTVHFVEIGDMTTHQLRCMLSELAKMHSTAQGGIHYILPVRNGKIGPDMVFEEEWLAVVRKTCEIVNGEIVLKGGAKEVLVIRDMI